MSATPEVPGRGAAPSLVNVLRGAWRGAAPGVRLGLAGLVLAWFAVSALQVWDVRGRTGPAVWAELASVVAGSLGTLLFCGAVVLDTAAGKPRPGTPEVALRQMLLALPVLASSASVLLAMAVGMALVRVALGGWPGLLGIVVWSLMLVLCGRAVLESSRALWGVARRQGEAAARAEAEAAEARLAALSARMDPHFLFNALNTVAALVRTDARAAEGCVEQLADVLRRTLGRAPMGTVAEEVDYLRAYLGIERVRWGERLDVSWDVAPEALPAPLPPMTLQPLVENALRHGIGGIDGGRIAIGASCAGGRLRLHVEDDGAGFPERVTEGVGLGNLRQRLATLYGGDAELRIERRAPGSRVVLDLPMAPRMAVAAGVRREPS